MKKIVIGLASVALAASLCGCVQDAPVREQPLEDAEIADIEQAEGLPDTVDETAGETEQEQAMEPGTDTETDDITNPATDEPEDPEAAMVGEAEEEPTV